jgi:hypothetical protein
LENTGVRAAPRRPLFRRSDLIKAAQEICTISIYYAKIQTIKINHLKSFLRNKIKGDELKKFKINLFVFGIILYIFIIPVLVYLLYKTGLNVEYKFLFVCVWLLICPPLIVAIFGFLYYTEIETDGGKLVFRKLIGQPSVFEINDLLEVVDESFGRKRIVFIFKNNINLYFFPLVFFKDKLLKFIKEVAIMKRSILNDDSEGIIADFNDNKIKY